MCDTYKRTQWHMSNLAAADPLAMIVMYLVTRTCSRSLARNEARKDNKHATRMHKTVPTYTSVWACACAGKLECGVERLAASGSQLGKRQTPRAATKHMMTDRYRVPVALRAPIDFSIPAHDSTRASSYHGPWGSDSAHHHPSVWRPRILGSV
jgi:hypothetical protein